MLSAYQQFFTGRPTTAIARDLLGRQLIYEDDQGPVGGLIVECEAYLGETDSASHAFGGRHTGYTASLYGQPGDIYLYQIRGRYCFDVVTQDAGEPQGILIRGIEPTVQPGVMAANRHQTGRLVSNGPTKLIEALGIHSRELDGQPMETSPLRVQLAPLKIAREIITTARVGMNPHGKDAAAPRRFYVAGNPYVSGLRKREIDAEHHGWV